jgi:hypothetical protein
LHIRSTRGPRKSCVKAAVFILVFPLMARCAALDRYAMAPFQTPGVPGALYARVEHGAPLTLADVVTLSRVGVSRASIVDYLYSFGHAFRLTPQQVWQLRHAGVSADLLDYMTDPAAHANRLEF